MNDSTFNPNRPMTDAGYHATVKQFVSEQDRWAKALAPKPVKPTPMFKLPPVQPKKSLFKRLFG